MSSCLQDYVIENANFFNEFDKTNFINNASLALNTGATKLAVSIKGNTYSNILEKTMSHINEIELNSYAVAEFVTKILGSGRVESAKLTMKDITKVDNIIIKPQYLTEAVSNYKEVINGIASGKYDTDKIRDIYANMHLYTDTLKKRLVSSPINVNITTKEMLDHSISETVDVTTSYLEDKVLPFLQDFTKNKKTLTSEISIINTTLYSSVSELKKVVEDVNIGIELNKIDETKKKLMLNYTYNMVRAILEGVSFVTYAIIRKAHQFEECVIACQNIYNLLTLSFSDVINIIESGLYDNRSITADDAYDIAEKLVEGKNDVFAELSNNIIEYHKGYISSNASVAMDVSGGDVSDYVTNLLSENKYDNELYKDIVKSYIEINNGLDIVAKNYDDRLIVFEDIIKKAGFSLTLIDRFHNEIKALDDMSIYGMTALDIGNGGEKERIYYMILSEIADYPRLTESIAKVSREVKVRIDYIEDLFNDKRNTELAYSETMTELKIFLASFKDQFRELNMSIVKALYLRLKELANKADECIDNVFPSNEETVNFTESDFCKESVLYELEDIDTMNDVLMESLLKQYYAEREFIERGVRLVYEAVEVTDNNKESKGTNLITKIEDSFAKAFDNILANSKAWFDRSAKKNKEFMDKYKNYLANERKYVNIQIKMTPYEKMDSNQISSDINTLITNVGKMTPDVLKTLNSYEEVRSKLITFGINFNNTDEKTAITNYYSVGNNPIDPVTYSNGEIQTLVAQHMIPYCDTFYTSYKPGIDKQFDSLKEAVEKVSQIAVTESFVDIDLLSEIFTEAEAPAQQPATQPTQANQPAQTQQATAQTNNTQQQNTTTNANTTDKVPSTNVNKQRRWMEKCINKYTGCVMNAIRDRNRDYFRALNALLPKKMTTAPAVNTPANTEPAAQPAQNAQ